MDADLLGLGQHCSVPHCQQLDFLPFKCDCCNKIYCLDHRTYREHSCPAAAGKTLEVLPCPICAKGIHLKAGEDPNVVFFRHAGSSDCDPANYARVMKKRKCPVAGCKEKLTTINTYTCKTCNQKVCLKHRLEIDHKCPGKAAHPLAQRQSSSMAAAAAAAAAAAGRSLSNKASSLLSDIRGSTALSNSTSSSAQQAPRQQQQQLARVAEHQAAGKQQGQQRQAERQRTATAVATAAAVTAQGSANTLHGSAERRRQLLGLPPRQQQQREICPQCGLSFDTVAQLIQHAETAHGSGPTAAAAAGTNSLQGARAAGGDVFACPTCSQHFSDAALLVAHSE